VNPNPARLVAEFAHRTTINLHAIRTLRDQGAEVFEVTQLISSLLGLLVFPREHYLDYIPDKSLDELVADGWPIPRVNGGFSAPDDLRALITYLRNAVAHFNLELLPDSDNQIAGIRVWNIRNDKKDWIAELTISQLENIVTRFADLILEHAARLPAPRSRVSQVRSRPPARAAHGSTALSPAQCEAEVAAYREIWRALISANASVRALEMTAEPPSLFADATLESPDHAKITLACHRYLDAVAANEPFIPEVMFRKFGDLTCIFRQIVNAHVRVEDDLSKERAKAKANLERLPSRIGATCDAIRIRLSQLGETTQNGID
jgi:hypothetical protein